MNVCARGALCWAATAVDITSRGSVKLSSSPTARRQRQERTPPDDVLAVRIVMKNLWAPPTPRRSAVQFSAPNARADQTLIPKH
jgi:hypothetical protein